MFRSRFNPETNDSSVTPKNYRLLEDDLVKTYFYLELI